MEVSGELHIQVLYHWRSDAPYALNKEAQWTPKPVSTLWELRYISSPTKNQTRISFFIQSVYQLCYPSTNKVQSVKRSKLLGGTNKSFTSHFQFMYGIKSSRWVKKCFSSEGRTSRNHHYSLCNNPEEHSSQLLCSGSLKSHIKNPVSWKVVLRRLVKSY